MLITVSAVLVVAVVALSVVAIAAWRTAGNAQCASRTATRLALLSTLDHRPTTDDVAKAMSAGCRRGAHEIFDL